FLPLPLLYPPITTLFPYTTLFRSLYWAVLIKISRHLAEPKRKIGTSRIGPVHETLFNTSRTPGASRSRARWACPGPSSRRTRGRSEEHTSELQSRFDLVCRLLLEK